MQSSAMDSYLETQVMTAAPQELHLMLIEAAIRFIERARHHRRAKQDEQASDALARAQQIVTELLAGLNRQLDSKLTKKVAAVYLFVFRSLIDAHLKGDDKKLQGALKVLEIERETWRQLCKKLDSTDQSQNPCAEVPLSEPTSQKQVPPITDSLANSGLTGQPSSGLSLEA